jgi:2-polyprenyl-3-methyl-5-hydroxy-6-metoxy-1,4-benzoquinol methylase
MVEVIGVQPRWGNQGRDRKGHAIWSLVQAHVGGRIVGGVWLDVGCGSGGIAASIAPKVEQMIGVDPEPWESWGAAAVDNPNLKFITATFDSDRLSIEERSVDVLICNQVYEHVSDPRQLIHNISEVLKPGGACYFAGPNLLWPLEPHVFWPVVHWLPRRMAQNLMRLSGSKQADDLDAHSKPSWVLRRWFRQAGLRCINALQERVAIELSGRGHPGAARLVRALPAVLFVILEPVSPGFVFVLRKSEA